MTPRGAAPEDETGGGRLHGPTAEHPIPRLAPLTSDAAPGERVGLPQGPKSWVSGSDVSTWAYCGRLFWLTRQRHEEPAEPQMQTRLADGVVAHAAHGTVAARQRRITVMALQGLWGSMGFALLLWFVQQWWVTRQEVADTWVDLALGALGLTVVVVLWAQHQRRLLSQATLLPETATVAEEDTVVRSQRPLRASQSRLYGRPDYILEEPVGAQVLRVPVELKPTKQSERLYEADELQVLLYLEILRELDPVTAATFGRVIYATRPFVVERTPDALARLQAVVEAVRAARLSGVPVDRTHQVRGRCRGCAMRTQCDQTLWTERPPAAKRVAPSRPAAGRDVGAQTRPAADP